MVRAALFRQTGITLIEIIVSVALLSILGSALVGALGTGIKGTIKVDERTTAINLARSQLEYIRTLPYTEPPVYPTLTPPTGYTITVTGSTLTANVLQKLIVSVTANGVPVLDLEGYRLNEARSAVPTVTPTPTPTP